VVRSCCSERLPPCGMGGVVKRTPTLYPALKLVSRNAKSQRYELPGSNPGHERHPVSS
jgi:hypothetical protein